MKPNLSRLYDILRLRRPADSTTENNFVHNVLLPWLPSPHMDEHGNVHCQIGDAPKTMFASHTDTVHAKDGTQKLVYDREKFHLFTQDIDSNCLGADDGTGIWLMCHMIENKVPGLYIFHREEEIGGRGSAALAKNPPPSFDLLERCISFDRKGYSDIITYQGATRTASDKFANALAAQLHGFSANDGGVFTDSKNYRHLIPECTNLSVGYFHQHTPNEYQDLKFAVMLANQLCAVQWDALPTERDPTIRPAPPTHTWYGGSLPSLSELNAWVVKEPAAAARLLYELNARKNDMERAEQHVRTQNWYTETYNS